MIGKFWDEKDHGFYMTASDHEPLIARLKSSMDDAMPSANAIAALALLRLGRLTGIQLFEEKGRQTVQAFQGGMEQRPAAFTATIVGHGFYGNFPGGDRFVRSEGGQGVSKNAGDDLSGLPP